VLIPDYLIPADPSSPVGDKPGAYLSVSLPGPSASALARLADAATLAAQAGLRMTASRHSYDDSPDIVAIDVQVHSVSRALSVHLQASLPAGSARQADRDPSPMAGYAFDTEGVLAVVAQAMADADEALHGEKPLPSADPGKVGA
jgi:hypothetical protein